MFVNVLLVVKWCWGLYPGVSSIVFHQKVGRVHCEYAGKRKTYSKTQSKIHCKSLRKPLLRFIYLLPSYPSQDFYSTNLLCRCWMVWYLPSPLVSWQWCREWRWVRRWRSLACWLCGGWCWGVTQHTFRWRFVLRTLEQIQASASGGMKLHWEALGKKDTSQQKTSWNTPKKNPTKKYPMIIKVYQE